MAGRRAPGAGGRGALLRARVERERQGLQPVRRHAQPGVPRLPRRGALHERRPSQPPPGRSSPTAATVATTFFFSTSGGYTENIENAFVGSQPRAVAEGRQGPLRRPLALPPLGLVHFSRADAGREARQLGQGPLPRDQGAEARRLAAGREGTHRRARGAARSSPGRRSARASACATPGSTCAACRPQKSPRGGPHAARRPAARGAARDDRRPGSRDRARCSAVRATGGRTRAPSPCSKRLLRDPRRHARGCTGWSPAGRPARRCASTRRQSASNLRPTA